MDLVYQRKNVRVGHMDGQRYIVQVTIDMVRSKSSGTQRLMFFYVGW